MDYPMSHVQRAQRVFKSCMDRAWEDLIRKSQLFDASQPLERRGVNDIDLGLSQENEAVNGVTDGLGVLHLEVEHEANLYPYKHSTEKCSNPLEPARQRDG